MHTAGSAVSGYTVLLIVQLAFVVVFGVYTKYGDELLPQDDGLADEGPVIDELMDGKNHTDAHAEGNRRLKRGWGWLVRLGEGGGDRFDGAR